MESNYIRIFATAFLNEDERQLIEFRISGISYGYSLSHRIHSGLSLAEYLTDWKAVAQSPNLDDLVYKIFDSLRSMEIENGLYKGVASEEYDA